MKLILALALALFSLILISCGGGSNVASNNGGGVGSGGTGISMGTVTGFGSIVIDGVAHSSATPQFYVGNDLSDKAVASPANILLGAHLLVQFDKNGNPASMTEVPELIGLVSQINANGFTVNTVPVQVNTSANAGPVTYYSGLAGSAAIRVGMQVAVSGAYAVDAAGLGYVQATLVERRPAASIVTRVSGFISDLNSSTHSFNLAGMSVKYDSSSTITPAGAALVNGKFVNVWSNRPLTSNGTALAAGSIHLLSLAGQSGLAQISGLVSRLSGSSFQIDGMVVDASASALSLVLAELTNGQYVTVKGTINASTGAVSATSIKSYAHQPVMVELQGSINGYLGPNAFFVRGVAVDASNATFLNGATAASLANGVYVDIKGAIATPSSNFVNVTEVSVLSSPPTGKTVNYHGSISQVNAMAKTFVLTRKVGGTDTLEFVSQSANMSYSNGTAAQLVNGAYVELEATQTASGLSAYSLSFVSAPPSGAGTAQPILIHGRVSALTDTSFELAGIVIQYSPATPLDGILSEGAKVDVWFTPSGAINQAQIIDVGD